MKNNEIMISAKFKGAGINDELSFLVLKDISLRALIEAIYFGLKKSGQYEEHFKLLEEYFRTRKELQILYGSKEEYRIIDFSEEGILDKNLDELGFVTSSCVLFTDETLVISNTLFQKKGNSYILNSNDSLEYNISTRRLNVIEPSVIDILPAGEMPGKNKASLGGVYMLKKDFTVTRSRSAFRLVLFIFGFFVVVMFFTPLNFVSYIIVTLIIFIPCLLAMVWLKLFNITVNGDKIIVKKRPGIVYSFDISEIKKVELKVIESGVGDFIRMTIETASRQVTIESVQNGFYDMLEFILENVDNSKIIYPSENPAQ